MGVLNTFPFFFAENFALPLFWDFFFGVWLLMSQRSSDDVMSFFTSLKSLSNPVAEDCRRKENYLLEKQPAHHYIKN